MRSVLESKRINGDQCAGRVREWAPQVPRTATGRGAAEAHPTVADDLGHGIVSPIVQEVLSSSGQSLDPETLAFFESRFRHNFASVRVHTGILADDSAKALDAHAYTVGHHVVFGAGRYAPGDREGRELLAHELTHVVQQETLESVEPIPTDSLSDDLERQADYLSTVLMNGDFSPASESVPRSERAWSVSMPTRLIQRKGAKGAEAARKSDARLAALARDPREALAVWNTLGTAEKMAVLERVARRHGAHFADQFRQVAQHGKPNFTMIYWQPGVGPTGRELEARGWSFLGMEITGSGAIDVEIWVNPSGETIRRDVSMASGKAVEPPTDGCEDKKEEVAAFASLVQDSVRAYTEQQKSLEQSKHALETADKTTPVYRRDYERYTGSLQELSDGVKREIDTANEVRKQLGDPLCPEADLRPMDDQIADLTEISFWVDFESDPFTLQFLQPIKATLKVP